MPAPTSAWRLVLDTVLDAAVIMDREGKVVDWNENATTVFGWTAGEAIGRTMADLIIPPQFREAHVRGLRRYLDTGEAKVLGRRIEISGLRRSGEEFPVELSISPISEDDGLIFVGFLRDISERRNAEQQREQHALALRDHASALEVEIKERIRAQAHQQLLLAEVNHRVKNMLAVVTAIAAQTARNNTTIEGFNQSFLARLQALSDAHSLLTRRNWQAVPLGELAEAILSPHRSHHHVDLRGGPVSIPPKAVLSVGLVLHELVTNATKYGALSVPAGKVSVEWETNVRSDPMLDLRWTESGVGPIMPPTRTGFGSAMIRASIQHDLNGRVNVSYGDDGIRYDFEIPLKASG